MPSPTDPRFGYQGYLDLWLPLGMPEARGDEGPCLPNVRDFKTTGNWKYAKTPAQLATDVQAQLYATWAMWETGARVVDLDWIYFATKGAHKAKRVHLRVHADHVAEQFSKINATAETMYAARQSVTNPLELRANPDMCGGYGGCPYRDKCNLSPGEIVDAAAAQWARNTEKSNMTQATDTGSLLARMKAQKAAQTKAGIPVENLPTWATAPVDPRAPIGINPPESALPPAPPVGVPAPVVAAPVLTPAQSYYAPPVVAVEAAAPAAVVEPVKRRGPGRPKKDPLAADVSLHVTPAPAPSGTGDVAPAAFATEQPEDSAQLGKLPSAWTVVSRSKLEPQAVSDEGTGVSVVWGEETLCPVPYNPFRIGPFTASGFVRKGETIGQASQRLYDELESFAEGVRATKAASFAEALGKAIK